MPIWDRADQANRAARFLAQRTADERPCLEVAGVQTYLYLDPETRTVVVSVDLDTTDPELLTGPMDQVPLRLTINGLSVYDSTQDPT